MTRYYYFRYTCTADNGVGNPVFEDITLKVLYPPVATAERPVVLGGDGCALELVCNADGFPEPAVMLPRDDEAGSYEQHCDRHYWTQEQAHILKV